MMVSGIDDLRVRRPASSGSPSYHSGTTVGAERPNVGDANFIRWSDKMPWRVN